MRKCAQDTGTSAGAVRDNIHPNIATVAGLGPTGVAGVVVLPEHAAGNLLVHHRVHDGEVPDAAKAVDELASVPPISPFYLLLTLLSLLRLPLLNTFH